MDRISKNAGIKKHGAGHVARRPGRMVQAGPVTDANAREGRRGFLAACQRQLGRTPVQHAQPDHDNNAKD